MTQEEYGSATAAVKEDYIRALNTELLAGSGYDILVLDGLPADSFIEKGILSDLSDLLQPMIDEGVLHKNIMDNYIKNRKIYSVPARFGINVLFGKTADTKNLTIIKTLADYATDNMADSLFGSMTLEDLIDTFAPYQLNEILNSDGTINRDNLINTLNTLKQIGDNCSIVAEYSEEEGPGNSIWNLSTNATLCLNTPKSFLDAIFPFGMTAHADGYYTSFENSFTPSCELGIISKSKQNALSKEFIRMVLSEDIQIIDLYDGFPVNSQALTNSSLQDRSNHSVGVSSTNEDGSVSMLTLEALNKEQTEDVVNICSTVTKKVTVNEYITAAIKAKAKDFFNGGQSAPDAADAIIEELNVYLSE
jgi:ABC-type glycerol-3-phosphate transport system substrate-binding protein